MALCFAAMTEPSSLRVLCAILLSGLMTISADASDRWHDVKDTVFINYTTDDGFPPGPVSAIAQDAYGFIWCVTADGVARWDGYSLVYPEALRDLTDVWTMISAPGGLWMGGGMGLAFYDQETADLQWRLQSPRLESVILDMLFVDQDVAWIATENGVVRYQLDEDVATPLLQLELPLRVFDVAKDDRGDIWAASERGLYRKRDEDNDFRLTSLSDSLPDDLRISSLLVDMHGQLWIGTARHGVFVERDGAFESQELLDFDDDWIFSIEEVAPGTLWFGTYGRGIIEIATDNRQRRIRHNRVVRYSLAHDQVRSLERDSAGRVWVGTSRGLGFAHPESAVTTVFGDAGDASDIRGDRVRSFLPLKDGQVWVGLESGGVDLLDPSLGRTESIASSASGDGGLPVGAVEILSEYPGEGLLIGSNWGLFGYQNHILSQIRVEGRDPDAYTGSLALIPDGLLAGGVDGLWSMHETATGFEARAVHDDSWADKRITVVLPWRDGHVVGTWDGVHWLDANHQLISRLAQADVEPPLANGFVTSVAIDDEDRIWFGTTGGGIYRAAADNPDGALEVIDRASGLSSNMIGAVAFDRHGRLWVSTSAGLSVVLQDLSVIPLEREDGAVLAPYLRNAAAATPQGEILFGGDGGISIVDPDSWTPAPRNDPVRLVRIQMGNSTIRGTVAELVVPPATALLEIEFAALDYDASSSLSYRYRMLGFDSQWRETSAGHRVATYTSLTAGEYQFDVEVADGVGGWYGLDRPLSVSVMPLWYEQTGIRILFACGFAVAVILLLRWRTSRLRERQLELESLVAERTYALAESTEALRAKTAELERVSITDPLTGLFNRRYAEQTMDGRNTGVSAPSSTVFLLDIDHFKEVNDALGHAAGDEVLEQVADRLRKLVREEDDIIRWGGEEFLVILRSGDARRARVLAENIRQSLAERPFVLASHGEVAVTGTVGFCPHPLGKARAWADSVRLADHAMYCGKRAGRDVWVGLEGGEGADAVALREHSISEAIKKGALRIISSREDTDMSGWFLEQVQAHEPSG